MKLLSYSKNQNDAPRVGFLQNNRVIDVVRAAMWIKDDKNQSDFLKIPTTMRGILRTWTTEFNRLRELSDTISGVGVETLNAGNNPVSMEERSVHFHSPVPDPPSFRDFYAFEQHVKAARKLRGLEMNPLWYDIPIFYFSNHIVLYGHGNEVRYPQGSKELDFELEFAAVIATGGSDISAEDADQFIAGYTILNDWSARDFQREEMQLNLGPAKGKDFGSSFGPYLVTPDELEDAWDDNGKLNLRMTCHVNDKLISDGNTDDLYHSFPTMIERASRNSSVQAGDYLGSGTVGTGCILELRPENAGGWIQRGDVVRMEVERLGVLENKVV